MKKNNKKSNSFENKNESKLSFELHSDAVERLVTANEDNAPEVSDEEINKYKKDKLAKIPVWIKALFIKFWFNGSVCFFFLWGLGIYISGVIEQILILSVAMGIITDLLVNNIFRFFDTDGKYLRWSMFPTKKLWTLFANVLYAFVIIFAVVYTYQGANAFTISLVGASSDSVFFGVEPIVFGLLYLVYDIVFLGLKMFFKKLIKDANSKLDKIDAQSHKDDNQNN